MRNRTALAAVCLIVLGFEGAVRASILDQGNRLFIQEKYGQAIEAYQKFMETPLHPQDMDMAFFQMGECYRHLGNTMLAKQAYLKLIEEYPDSEFADDAYLALADFEEALGWNHLPKALVLCEKVVSMYGDTNSAPAAWVRLANLRARLRFYAGAEDAVKQLLQKFPESPYVPEGLFTLGQILANPVNVQRDPQMAVKMFMEIVNKHATFPRKEEVYFLLGNLLWEQTSAAEAVQYFKLLVTDYPDSILAPLAQTNIGLCYIDLEDYDRAAGAYQVLLQRFSQPAAVKENIRKLVDRLSSRAEDHLEVSAWNATMDKEQKVAVYTGDVQIKIGKMTIGADAASLNTTANSMSVSGHIRLAWGDDILIHTNRLDLDLVKKMAVSPQPAIVIRKSAHAVSEDSWDGVQFSFENGTVSKR